MATHGEQASLHICRGGLWSIESSCHVSRVDGSRGGAFACFVAEIIELHTAWLEGGTPLIGYANS